MLPSPTLPDNLTKKEPFLLDIISTLTRSISILMGMGLVIMTELTFIVFVLWASVMERFGIVLTQDESAVIINTIFALSIIALVAFLVIWINNIRKKH